MYRASTTTSKAAYYNTHVCTFIYLNNHGWPTRSGFPEWNTTQIKQWVTSRPSKDSAICSNWRTEFKGIMSLIPSYRRVSRQESNVWSDGGNRSWSGIRGSTRSNVQHFKASSILTETERGVTSTNRTHRTHGLCVYLWHTCGWCVGPPPLLIQSSERSHPMMSQVHFNSQ